MKAVESGVPGAARRSFCILVVAPQVCAPSWRVEPSRTGVRLLGRFRTSDAAPIVAAIREATTAVPSAEIDLDGVDQIDGGVITLLRTDLSARGVRMDLRGGVRFRPLFDLYGNAIQASTHRAQRRESGLAQIGRAAEHGVGAVKGSLGFLGRTTAAARRFVLRPRRGSWREVPPLVARSGPEALPIVLTINFLLGLVVAYMSARELRMFAANVYVADLIGIAMTRQLAPLMTAILVSGRSGAAFATELGSMKVSEEIDALRTLGLEPFAWLVLPRVLTLLLVVPVLTAIADVTGVLGGLVIAVTSLDLTPHRYFQELGEAVKPFDVWSGLFTSVAFAMAIGLIACEQGFAASGGPQGVGKRTTATVVRSIFALVVIDSAITVAFQVIGLG